jgi:hypothetical protein
VDRATPDGASRISFIDRDLMVRPFHTAIGCRWLYPSRDG